MKSKVVVSLVLLVAIFMRFYHLSEYFHFTMDEEYWLYIPYDIATGYHFPLIGGSIADTGLYTTPWFVYLMSTISFIGRGNPLFFAVFVSCLGVFTTFLIYLFGRQMFSERVALLASLLYGSSALISLWDRHYWNATLTPFLSLLTIFMLWLVSRGYPLAWIALSVILAIAVSAHGTGIALVLLVFLAIILGRLNVKKRYFLLGLTIFALSFSTQLFFELRHDFLESRELAKYVLSKKSSGGFLKQIYQVSNLTFQIAGKIVYYQSDGDTSRELTLGRKQSDQGRVPPIVSLVAVILFLFGFSQKRGNPSDHKYLASKLMGLLCLATFLGLVVFKSNLSGYYLAPAVIPFVFIWSLALDNLNRWKLGKILTVVIVVFYMFVNTSKIYFGYNSEGYAKKLKTAQQVIKLVGSEPFSLSVNSPDPWRIYGYRYPFTTLSHEPVQSYMDSYFSWLYDQRIPKIPPTRQVLISVNENSVQISVKDITQQKL